MNRNYRMSFKLLTLLYCRFSHEILKTARSLFYCLHSHWTFNFLCNRKEFLVLILFHKRELNTLQESLKYSRDCNNGFLFCKEHEGQSGRLAFEGFRITKLVLSLCLVWVNGYVQTLFFLEKFCFLWGWLAWRLLRVQNRHYCWVFSELACFIQYPHASK